MDVVLSLLILTSVCHGVEAVRCLECRHVSKPIHCHTVVQCPEGTVCGIERFALHNGLVTYDVGCKPQSCPGLHSEPHLPTKATRSSSPDCSECCNTDLCNAKGCGFQGFPTPRGPICYNCINTQFCEDVIGCNLDEECYMMGRYEYGDMVVTSGCRSSNICSEKHSGHAINLIGRKRRHVSIRQTNQKPQLCDTCCWEDLCNNGCNPNINSCGKLSAVTNLSISYTNNDTVVGSTVTFDCESGLMLNGSASSTCQADGLWDVQTFPVCQEVRSCFYIHQLNNNSSSGVYSIRLDDEGRKVTKQVYCDMETDGGGWTVVQRRLDGSVNFTRNFTEYVNGFGNIKGEYWLGLKWMRIISNAEPQRLRVDLVARDNTTAFATYSSFNLDSDSRYTLRLGSYSGNTSVSGFESHGMTYNNGYAFATYDKDTANHCGHREAAGWWYNFCSYVNINGVYDVPGNQCREGCLTWKGYKGFETLRGTSMKLRNI